MGFGKRVFQHINKQQEYPNSSKVLIGRLPRRKRSSLSTAAIPVSICCIPIEVVGDVQLEVRVSEGRFGECLSFRFYYIPLAKLSQL